MINTCAYKTQHLPLPQGAYLDARPKSLDAFARRLDQGHHVLLTLAQDIDVRPSVVRPREPDLHGLKDPIYVCLMCLRARAEPLYVCLIRRPPT